MLCLRRDEVRRLVVLRLKQDMPMGTEIEVRVNLFKIIGGYKTVLLGFTAHEAVNIVRSEVDKVWQANGSQINLRDMAYISRTEGEAVTFHFTKAMPAGTELEVMLLKFVAGHGKRVLLGFGRDRSIQVARNEKRPETQRRNRRRRYANQLKRESLQGGVV